MARKLKEFQAQFGFYDSVVAAPSQAAALRAWGAHQGLFTDGHARQTTDEQAIAAALEHPEIPLRRPVGSDDAFSLKPRLPRWPDEPEERAVSISTAPSKDAPQSRLAARPRPARPDRSALDAAKAALSSIQRDRRKEEETLRERRDALDAEEAEARRRYEQVRKEADRALDVAAKAFARAGRRIDSDR